MTQCSTACNQHVLIYIMVFSETPVTYKNGPKSKSILWSTNSIMGPKIEAIRYTKVQKRGNLGKQADKQYVIDCLLKCVQRNIMFMQGKLLQLFLVYVVSKLAILDPLPPFPLEMTQFMDGPLGSFQSSGSVSFLQALNSVLIKEYLLFQRCPANWVFDPN